MVFRTRGPWRNQGPFRPPHQWDGGTEIRLECLGEETKLKKSLRPNFYTEFFSKRRFFYKECEGSSPFTKKQRRDNVVRPIVKCLK